MNIALRSPRAHGFQRVVGRLKSQNKDFLVTERLPEIPSGEGEHLWLRVEKDGQNTAWVAKQISRWIGCQPRDVSYAGLKDRHAVTEQTFSIHLPGKESPSLETFDIEGVRIIEAKRHGRKLKTGHLIGNHFEIRVRDHDVTDFTLLKQNWLTVNHKGVPNYFGPQRFGHSGNNVKRGIDWLLGISKAPKQLQSIYLSAVRSFLFNTLLANRVETNNWDKLIDGDFAQFTEGKTGFYCGVVEENDQQRCHEGQVSPCASLPGESRDDFPLLAERESEQLEPYVSAIEALYSKRVSRHFRKLRIIPEKPSFNIVDGDPVFGFFLPAGSYATAVLEELVDWQAFGAGAVDWNE